MRFGRPNWNKTFPAVFKAHEGNNIGVFCCGPMGKALRAACMKFSEVNSGGLQNKSGKKLDTVFKLHAEVF